MAAVILIAPGHLWSGQLEHSVRVRVFANAKLGAVEFESIGSESLIVTEGGVILAELPAGETAVVERWQGMLRVRWSRGSVPLERCELGGAEIIRITPDGQRGRQYRGSFEVALDQPGDKGLQIVNVVNLELYVASVLPAEYPFTEVEGMKAQAIVIRTYALTATPRNGSEYQLLDDTGSQVYRGVETETELSRSVAMMTAGSALLYDGEAIEAVYSSHCGGHSANNEDVWGTRPLPYLRATKDPYDHDAPVSAWATSVDSGKLLDELSDRLGRRVKSFEVSDRGAGKHVRSVRIRSKDAPDEELSGERFRSLVNRSHGDQLIRSSSFEIKKQGGQFRFKGRGYGHGVGFCQWGAAAQAKAGRSSEDILKFYYRGVDVSKPEPEAVAFFAEGDVDSGPAPPPVVHNQPTGKEPATKKRKRRPGW